MQKTFSIANLVQIAIETESTDPKILAKHMECPPERAKEASREITFAEEVLKYLKRCSLDETCKKMGVEKNFLMPYVMALTIAYPGLLTFDKISTSTIKTSVGKIKRAAAVKYRLASGQTEERVASDLGLSPATLHNIAGNYDNFVYQLDHIETLEKKDDILAFFNANPYSTIYEASQNISLPPQKIRDHVESMVAAGEKIPYRNMPNELEMEAIKNDLISMKLEEPGISNKEIANRIGISPTFVSDIIRQTARTWERERTESYEFYYQSVVADLKVVKELAIERFKATPNSSSKWLEIDLTASNHLIEMLGLKAPQRHEIDKHIQYEMTSKERDQIVDASIRTDALDVDFSKIEVTGENE